MKRKNISVIYDDCGNRNIGEALKEIRLDSGHDSQQALSELLNRDRSGLSKYELGKTVPGLPTLYEIAEILEYDIEIAFNPKEKNIMNKNEATMHKNLKISKDKDDLTEMFNMFELTSDVKLRNNFVEKIEEKGIYINRADFDDIGRYILLYSYSSSIIEYYERMSDDSREIVDRYIDRAVLDEVINDMQEYLENDYKLNDSEVLTISEYICKKDLNSKFAYEMKCRMGILDNIESNKVILSGLKEVLPEDEGIDLIIKDIMYALLLQRSVGEICMLGLDMEELISRNKDNNDVFSAMESLTKAFVEMSLREHPEQKIDNLEKLICNAVNINELQESVTVQTVLDIIENIK